MGGNLLDFRTNGTTVVVEISYESRDERDTDIKEARRKEREEELKYPSDFSPPFFR